MDKLVNGIIEGYFRGYSLEELIQGAKDLMEINYIKLDYERMLNNGHNTKFQTTS